MEGVVGVAKGEVDDVLAASRMDRIKALVFAYGVADVAWYAYLRRAGQLGNDALTRRTYGDGPQSRPESFRGLGAVAKLPLRCRCSSCRPGRSPRPPRPASSLTGSWFKQRPRLLN